MGLYQKYLLPKILNAAMSRDDLTALRAELVPRARGEVLEIGIGSGKNLPFYGENVRRVYGVEPSAEMRKLVRDKLRSGVVEFLDQSAETTIPLGAESIDTVVSTWSLCSIPDAVEALRQAGRVLRRDGELLFVEHGRAPDSGPRAWQDRLNPLWTHIAGGCNLNRDMTAIVESAGFEITELKTQYLPGPKALTWTFLGVARIRPGIAPDPGSVAS
jgi:ubiquinone/menaquinone biosynthesis C-methylase UbiE